MVFLVQDHWINGRQRDVQGFSVSWKSNIENYSSKHWKKQIRSRELTCLTFGSHEAIWDPCMGCAWYVYLPFTIICQQKSIIHVRLAIPWKSICRWSCWMVLFPQKWHCFKSKGLFHEQFWGRLCGSNGRFDFRGQYYPKDIYHINSLPLGFHAKYIPCKSSKNY